MERWSSRLSFISNIRFRTCDNRGVVSHSERSTMHSTRLYPKVSKHQHVPMHLGCMDCVKSARDLAQLGNSVYAETYESKDASSVLIDGCTSHLLGYA